MMNRHFPERGGSEEHRAEEKVREGIKEVKEKGNPLTEEEKRKREQASTTGNIR